MWECFHITFPEASCERVILLCTISPYDVDVDYGVFDCVRTAVHYGLAQQMEQFTVTVCLLFICFTFTQRDREKRVMVESFS